MPATTELIFNSKSLYFIIGEEKEEQKQEEMASRVKHEDEKVQNQIL